VIREGVRPGVVRGGRVGEAAVRIEHQRAVQDTGVQDRGQRIPLDVCVVGQNARGGHDQDRGRSHRVRVIGRNRGVVHCGDRDRHGGRKRVDLPVGGMIGEAVRAGPVRTRRVGEAAVRIERQGAIGYAGVQNGRQRITIIVRVIGQDAWGSHDQGRVLIRGIRVIGRSRAPVELDRGGHGPALGIACLVACLKGPLSCGRDDDHVNIGRARISHGRARHLERAVSLVARHGEGQVRERPAPGWSRDRDRHSRVDHVIGDIDHEIGIDRIGITGGDSLVHCLGQVHGPRTICQRSGCDGPTRAPLSSWAEHLAPGPGDREYGPRVNRHNQCHQRYGHPK